MVGAEYKKKQAIQSLRALDHTQRLKGKYEERPKWRKELAKREFLYLDHSFDAGLIAERTYFDPDDYLTKLPEKKSKDDEDVDQEELNVSTVLAPITNEVEMAPIKPMKKKMIQKQKRPKRDYYRFSHL